VQYKVPQFIEVEDKLFGPLTFKQAVYLAGGVGASFVLWNFLPHFIAVILIVPIIALSLALAFYKVNDQPFIVTMQAFIKYTFSDKIYVWKKDEKRLEKLRQERADKRNKESAQERKEREAMNVPTMSGSKLKDLSWSLDVNEKLDNNA